MSSDCVEKFAVAKRRHGVHRRALKQRGCPHEHYGAGWARLELQPRVKTNGEDSRKSGAPPELAHDTLACAAIVRVYLKGAAEEGGGAVKTFALT